MFKIYFSPEKYPYNNLKEKTENFVLFCDGGFALCSLLILLEVLI